MSQVPDTGRVIADRYRLLDPLGEGAVGTVWRARDEVLGREVAVKEVRVPPGLSADEAGRLLSRLEDEARTASRVTHRNVVTVHDVVTEDSRPWIVMEVVRGLVLSDVLDADGPLSPRRAARIGAEVLAALRGGHEAGAVHRDVRPGNVMLANDGRVMLKDFGITADRGAPAATVAGEPITSPEYAAPERALGRTPGPESDLWSLGVLLYTAAEGRSPFRRDTPAESLRAVGDAEPPPLQRAGALGPVIEGLLRRDPAERLAAAEAERRLRILAAGGTGSAPVTPSPPSPADETDGTDEADTTTAADAADRTGRTGVLVAVVAVFVLLLAGGLVWALTGDDEPGRKNGGAAVTDRSAGPPPEVRAGPAPAHGKGAPQDGAPSSSARG
ncbi:serine/threonine-protein kinase [Streptomyces sp. NPDC006296]|uniref:serine/threonine-protein kinase n=1 Tax=Streptomyces sp. NPDC006296 TaxID=3156746 RepID=UPI0033BC4AF3